MKKHFLVVADSFIGMNMVRADDKKVVEIETDIAKGGMTPGENLLEVEQEDNADGSTRWVSVAERSARSAKKSKPAKEIVKEPVEGGDLA